MIFININENNNFNFLPGWKTDGRAVIVRYDPLDNIKDIFMFGGNYLFYNDQGLIENKTYNPITKIYF